MSMFSSVVRKRLVQASFVLWVPGVLLPCAYFLAGHLLTLPEPDHSALQGALMGLFRKKPPTEATVAVHVLYSECGCSQRVLRQLAKRKPMAGVEERVWIVDAEPSTVEALAARGFVARGIDRVELWERFHIEAAPLLVVVEAEGRVRYLGGYTDRKRGPDIKDLDLMAAVARGERPEPLPLFGCATSARLQAQVDPLGLK